MMPEGRPANDEERLPWLEPYRDLGGKARPKAAAAAAPAKPKKRGAALLAGGVAAIAAALTAGYWIGQRDTAAPPPVRVVVAAKPAPSAAPVVAEAPPAEMQPPVAPAAPEPRVGVHRPAPRHSPIVRQRKIRSAGLESAHLKEVEAAQQRAAAARQSAARRAWPKMPSPGPAGQVIQLGAFRSPTGAYAAYRLRLARYPMLGTMPRVVVPVITRPTGQILYVLRLGTTSRQQSGIVCRNLRASGDHCLVIG
jgi:hypothetical protein